MLHVITTVPVVSTSDFINLLTHTYKSIQTFSLTYIIEVISTPVIFVIRYNPMVSYINPPPFFYSQTMFFAQKGRLLVSFRLNLQFFKYKYLHKVTQISKHTL